jgi:hypothetical protein
MTDKNYNPRFLRGDTTYNDTQFQADMKDVGIHIPDEALGTPSLHLHAAEAVRQQSKKGLPSQINPDTGRKFTQEEADAYADEAYEKVIDKMSMLSETDLRKLK